MDANDVIEQLRVELAALHGQGRRTVQISKLDAFLAGLQVKANQAGSESSDASRAESQTGRASEMQTDV